MDFSKLRINCNRLTKIFAGNSHGITEKELKRIGALIDKETGKALTPKEYERLEALQEKERHSSPHTMGIGAQAYLLYIYSIKKYGRPLKLFTNGYMEPSASNGILKEKTVIDLVEKTSGIKIYRSKVTLKNDYLVGVPDAFDNEDWQLSSMVHEIKTTNNHIKFNIKKRYPLNTHNFLQAQGYMALTNKKKAVIHYCLVDYPERVILSQKEAMFDYFCPDGVETDTFLHEWAVMEGKMRFSNYPDSDRIFNCFIDRDDRIIDKIYKRVTASRNWLNDFAEFDKNVEKDNICQPQRNSFLVLLRRLGFE